MVQFKEIICIYLRGNQVCHGTLVKIRGQLEGLLQVHSSTMWVLGPDSGVSARSLVPPTEPFCHKDVIHM